MRQSISYLLVFIGIQLCAGGIVTVVWKQLTGSSDLTTTQVVVSTVTVSVLTIAVFLLTRWTLVSPRWLRTRPWSVLAWSVLAALGCVIPSVWLQEHIPELPNWVESEFDMILRNRWGYLAVGLLAPLSEEMVFRGAILRQLLQSYAPWTAIAVSALLFALVHFNPAQMPHAFVIGLLLGWMYWRTGSILPGVAFHWANNSVAYIIYNLFPDPDIRLIDVFKGSEPHVLLAVLFSLLILLPSLFQLHQRMRHAQSLNGD